MPRFDPSKKLSAEDALKRIKEIIDYGHVILTPHVRERMKNRNFTDIDIIHVLENGAVTGEEFDDLRNNWKYRVSGKDIEGESGVVITAIVDYDRQVIVTAF
jgi:hypothetical protein